MAECAVPSCENEATRTKRTICEMHYYRFRRTGQYDLHAERPPLPPAPCAAAPCDNRASNWADDLHVCTMHWKRWRRNGHFGTVRSQTPPRARREECKIDGCTTTDDGPHGLCKKHKSRLDRQGDPMIAIPQADRNMPSGHLHRAWTGDDASYSAVHQRLRILLGAAHAHACVNCDGLAAHWSYNHDDPDEKHSPVGPFSLNPDSYKPRCVGCHKRFDVSRLGGTG